MARRARLADRIVAPEEALLSGRFVRYAARRLTAFTLARGWATALHILELTWLAGIFSAKSFVASLALQNVTLVLDAAYWGALEAMRRRARELGQSSEAAAMVTRWLTAAIWAGWAIAIVPMARATWDFVRHEQTPSMLHIYALACAFRLGADIVVRTYYSGVYAYGRVHRPIWSVFVGPIVLVFGTLALWRLRRTARLMKDEAAEERARVLAAVANEAFDVRSELALPHAPLVAGLVSDRHQLAELDHRVARCIAEEATGQLGPRAFRGLSYRFLRREAGLESRVVARNRGR